MRFRYDNFSCSSSQKRGLSARDREPRKHSSAGAARTAAFAGINGLGHWSRTLAVVTFGMVFASQALACNTVGVAHLGSAGADRVIVNFQNRRSAMEIKDKAFIDALPDYFMDLGGAWRSTVVATSTLNGDIHFYRAELAVESFWVSPTTIGRGGCYRDFAPKELSALVALPKISPSDLGK